MTKRRLLVAVVAAVLIAGCVKKMKSHRESEWHGLTETEARSKLEGKLPSRVPEDKRSAISDKVIAKMRDRGVISEDRDVADEPSETTETVDLRESAGEAAELAEN